MKSENTLQAVAPAPSAQPDVRSTPDFTFEELKAAAASGRGLRERQRHEPHHPPLLHKEKAARELLGGISHSLLFKLIQTGQLPVVRLCGRNLYSDDDIRELIAKRRIVISDGTEAA